MCNRKSHGAHDSQPARSKKQQSTNDRVPRVARVVDQPQKNNDEGAIHAVCYEGGTEKCGVTPPLGNPGRDAQLGDQHGAEDDLGGAP